VRIPWFLHGKFFQGSLIFVSKMVQRLRPYSQMLDWAEKTWQGKTQNKATVFFLPSLYSPV